MATSLGRHHLSGRVYFPEIRRFQCSVDYKRMKPLQDESPLTRHLALVERILRSIARRKCLSPDAAEEFASRARLYLLEDDCAVLRKFRGRSSLSTYLTTVLTRLYLDYRRSAWGKWRGSAVAKRSGLTAQKLEILLYRDGFSFDEAVEILQRNHGVSESTEHLAEIAGRLPPRQSRRHLGEEALASATSGYRADDRLRENEANASADRVGGILSSALSEVPPEDRLILRLWSESGFTVAAIARTLDLDQKPLYRRLEQLLVRLREALEARGLDRDQVLEVLREQPGAIPVDFGSLAEGRAVRPSQQRGEL